MATTIHSLSDRTQKHIAFQQWLHDSLPKLQQAAQGIIDAEHMPYWLQILTSNGRRDDIFPALVQLNLPLLKIAALFQSTAELLPRQNPEFWQFFSATQTQVMAILGETSNISSQHQRIGALSKLPAMAQDISNSKQLMENVVALLSDVFYNSSVNLYLTTDVSGLFSLPVAQWINTKPTEKEKAGLAQTISGIDSSVKQALVTGSPQISHRITYSLPPKISDVHEEMVAPMLKQQQVLGIIQILNHGLQPYTLTDLSFLDAVASELTMLLDAADLQTTVAHQDKEKQILLETNAALSRGGKVTDAINALVEKITEALDVGACTISRWNSAGNTLTAIAEYVAPAPDTPPRTWRNLHQPIPLASDPIGMQVMKNMEPVSKRVAVSRLNANTNEHYWARYGWQSILAIPLGDTSHKLGLLEVYDRRFQRHFSDNDTQLAQALANQAAIIINQLDLLQQTQQRLMEVSTLYTLSRQIISTSPLQLDELLHNIVTTVKEIVDCRACVLFLLDDSGKYLEIKAAAGIKKRWQNAARLAVGEGAAGQAVARKKTIYVADTRTDPDFIFFDHSIRSLVVVPLVFQGEIIGAINLDDTRAHAFGKAQERLLSIAANHAAIAIQNARLFQKVSFEEHRTRAILEHMADGVLLINRKGNIITVNPVLARMLNMRTADILGKNINNPKMPSKLKLIAAPLKRNQHTGQLASDVQLPGKEETTLRIIATPVRDENRQLLGEVRLIHDITYERRLERLKDDFISTISHELRTPLFSIQGFIRLILSGDVPDEATRREFLTIIERQANHLSELVSNLLDLNRISTNALGIEMKPVNIITVINQTILQLQGFSHKKKVTVTGKLPKTLPLVLGDPIRLEQVMTNLIGNAIKFTPQKGKVVVQAKAQRDSVLISVSDTGIGIPTEELERIFSKFYQVEEHSTRSAEGSGLGLHIARELIERHNGKLWAQSEVGKGSTFFVELPTSGSQKSPTGSIQ